MIVVIDDLRSFTDGRDALYARSSQEALVLLDELAATESVVDELWLGHDLGGFDTIRPVVLWLAERAATSTALPITAIYVHTANPSNADSMVRQLSLYYEKVSRIDANDAKLIAISW